jgi:predicted nucleic acid-binding Zn ribbon protein
VLGSRLCPVCRKQPIQGKQTACSAACRSRRRRDRATEGRALRDQEILALLEHAERLEARALELRSQARRMLAGHA